MERKEGVQCIYSTGHMLLMLEQVVAVWKDTEVLCTYILINTTLGSAIYHTAEVKQSVVHMD